MKAITIHQPWASLIAIGEKRFETRRWRTSYRGPIAIHAGKQKDFETCLMLAKEYTDIWHKITPLTFGSVIAIAHLAECWSVCQDYHSGMYYLYNGEDGITKRVGLKEEKFGWYKQGRYAWELTDVRQIDPIPAKGQQGLWNWEQAD